jgi:hypothetical protein
VSEGQHKHRDLWVALAGAFLGIAAAAAAAVWTVQQTVLAAHIHLWPNPFVVGALILAVISCYLILALIFQWWLPGGIEGGRTAHIPPPRKRKSRLLPGETMLVGQPLYSPDGRTRFVLNPDGNMIVYVQGRQDICDTGTRGRPRCLKLEQDGRLVLYDVDDQPLWQKGPGGTHLDVQDNSHVVLNPAEGDAIWATDIFVKGGMLVRWLPPELRQPTVATPALTLSQIGDGVLLAGSVAGITNN